MSYLVASLYYLCFLILLGLAIFIYRKSPRSWLHRYFALFALSLLSWLGTLYLFKQQDDTPLLTTLGRLNFACAAFVMLFGYLFLPQVAKWRARYTPLLVAETVLLAGLSFGTDLIDRAEHIANGQHITTFGPLFPLYILHLLGYLGAALYLTFIASRKASAQAQGQLAVIGLGMFVTAVIALGTNIVLPYAFNVFALQDIGALSTLALMAAFSYAISQHQLFDVRLIIRRTVVFTALLGLIVTVYGLTVLLFSTIVLRQEAHLDPMNFVVNVLSMTIVGFGVEPLRRWLSDATDHFLFRREYDQREVLRVLSQKLNDVLTLDEALDILMQTMVKVLHLGHGVTYVFQPGESGVPAIKRIKQVGYSSTSRLMLPMDNVVVPYFLAHPDILLASDLEATLATEEQRLKTLGRQNPEGQKVPDNTLPSTLYREHAIKRAVQKLFVELDAAIAIPLTLGEQPLGLILLSRKGSGDAYLREDLELLETIGGQAISSIQKAKLYEGDQMKTEFVSIASHELLTPISAMQGYLSMILDENIGKVDPQARDYLEKVYTSARRLSTLVKDLLSVSRIEAGRMKFEMQALDIGKAIEDAIDQLRFTAQEKGLALTFEPPARPLPPVWADPDRTTEVLINLIGNAIKYTPQGSVTVRASQGLSPVPHVRVEVSDTGLGMSKAAQSHLFEKFYRVASEQTTGIAGTGLGLYITKSMIEKMGGAITVRSTPGKGSTFAFTLPLFKVENSQP
jgi:signal transduction histidine kinase